MSVSKQSVAGFEPVLDNLRHYDEEDDDHRVEEVEQGRPTKELEE